jgi:uracil-DNA glycosylase family 4
VAVYDLALVNDKILIEVDGKSHCCAKAKSIDRLKNRIAAEEGYDILRVNYLSDPKDLIAELKRLLKNHNGQYQFIDAKVLKVSVRKSKRAKSLYCIEVDEDASFVAQGVVSHNCHPPGNRMPLRAEIEHCRLSIANDIEAHKPRVIVGAGKTPLEWATGETTITKWCGRFIPIMVGSTPCWFYSILHPAYILRQRAEDGWGDAFRHDLCRVAQWLERDPDPPCPEQIANLHDGCNYVLDAAALSKLERQMQRWVERGTTVAFDIETIGLRPYRFDDPRDGLLSIAFSDGKTTWAMPVNTKPATWDGPSLKRVFQIIYDFLRSSVVKVAHKLRFEMEWLTSIFGHEPRWPRAHWGDSMLQAYVLDERRGTHSLDFLCMQYFGFRLKAQSNVNVAKLVNADVRDLLKYNALDAKYEARLFAAQDKCIKHEQLHAAYRVHLKRVFTLVRAQQTGFPVDFARVKEHQQQLETKIAGCYRDIEDSREAKRYLKKAGRPLSPTSALQVTVLFRDILHRREGERSTNKSGYSVDDDALTAMNDVPVAKQILDLRHYAKMKSTYCDKYAEPGQLVYQDGRVHTEFNDGLTRTGRLSSEDPNMQNVPVRQDGWIRAMFVPPPGHIILSCDYGQIEYRILGVAANDAYIKKTLRDRYDVHLDWAQRVAKADPRVWRRFGKDIKKLRTEIKNTWVFPAFYGAHADYIARLLQMNIRACRDLFDEFWDEFKGVRKWQKRTMNFYLENGYVECLTKRRRRAPMTRNQIYNSPIQGTASDVVLDAMNRLSVKAERDGEPALQTVLNIHDDLTHFVPKKRREELQDKIVREMLTPSFDWIDVPISAEVKVGSDWSKMEAVDTFFSDEL